MNYSNISSKLRAMALLTAVCGLQLTAAAEDRKVEDTWDESSWKTATAKEVSIFPDAAYYDFSNIEVENTSEVKAVFLYKSGTHRQDTYGLEVIDADGNIVGSEYHFGYTGGQKLNNEYIVKNISKGKYTMRCWTGGRTNNEDNNSTGTLTLYIGDAEKANLTWNKQSWTPDPSKVTTDGLLEVYKGKFVGEAFYKYMDKSIILGADAEMKITYIYTSGSERVDLIGVEVIDTDGKVVASDGHYGFTGNQKVDNVYTLKGIDKAGIYTVRTWSNYVRPLTGTRGNITYDITETPDDNTLAILKQELSNACDEAESKLADSDYFKDNTPGYWGTEKKSEYENYINTRKKLAESDDATFDKIHEALTDIQNMFQNLSTNATLSVANGIYKIVNVEGNGSRGYIYDNNNANGYAYSSGKEQRPDNIDVNNEYWSVIPVAESYAIYNVGTKKFLKAPAAGGANNPWKVAEDEVSLISVSAAQAAFGTLEISSGNIHMSISNGYDGPVTAYYAAGDGGVPFRFERISEANSEVDKERIAKATLILAADAAIAKASPYAAGDKNLFGNGLNAYSGCTLDELNKYINDVKEAKKGYDLDAIEKAIEALNKAVDNIAINLPAANTFLRVRSTRNDIGMPYLLSHNSTAESSRGELNSQNDAASLFFYDGTSLLGYETGYYLKNNNNFAGFISDDKEVDNNTSTKVDFADGTQNTLGTYFVQFGGDDNATRYLYAQNKDGYSYTDAGQSYTTNQPGYAWWLESVTSLPVVINKDNDYTSLCAPVALTLPDNNSVKAYVVTNQKSNILTLTLVDDQVVAPNTPMIITAETAGTYNFGINYENGIVARAAANTYLLNYSTSTVTMPEGAYTLQVNGDTVGMYPAKEGDVLKGFSVYYTPLDSEPFSSYELVADGSTTTGIIDIVTKDTVSNVIYDLQGRRVNNASKGIYIVNGKKTLVK